MHEHMVIHAIVRLFLVDDRRMRSWMRPRSQWTLWSRRSLLPRRWMWVCHCCLVTVISCSFSVICSFCCTNALVAKSVGHITALSSAECSGRRSL